MRITDPGIDDKDQAFRAPSSSIMESIKAKAVASAATPDNDTPWQTNTETPKVDADIQSAKLKQLLGKIKTG
jgi:hypothetical protein